MTTVRNVMGLSFMCLNASQTVETAQDQLANTNALWVIVIRDDPPGRRHYVFMARDLRLGLPNKPPKQTLLSAFDLPKCPLAMALHPEADVSVIDSISIVCEGDGTLIGVALPSNMRDTR
jgi:hypothetical protein